MAFNLKKQKSKSNWIISRKKIVVETNIFLKPQPEVAEKMIEIIQIHCILKGVTSFVQKGEIGCIPVHA